MKKFVFVLGAGASVDLGLPMGSELTGQINQALNFDSSGYEVSGGDAVLRRAFTQSAQSHPRWFEASKLIANGMPLAPSIDNFVDVHREDQSVAFCAKAAITRCILSAEKSSKIYVDRGNTYNTIDFQDLKSWHVLFFRILTTNCTFQDLPDRLKSIGIVSFNYDRCFEHFMIYAIQTYYLVSATEAAKALASLEIYHPYGKVGALPYFANVGSVSYGAEVESRQLLEISKQIRTFTESTSPDSGEVAKFRSMVSQSRFLVFLGFAYHPINVQLILPRDSSTRIDYEKRIIGTALGSSQSDLRFIQDDLMAGYRCERTAVELRNDLRCTSLFTEYSRTLALA